jgi:hypothetical protein
VIHRTFALCSSLMAIMAFAVPAIAAEGPCELEPRTRCFGVESLDASLSTTQAGAHPDLTFTFTIKQDPESEENAFGFKDAFAPTRNVRIELPPGLIGDPNVLGPPQQCTVGELLSFGEPDGGCPNGSQVGVTRVVAYGLEDTFLEPVYMMQPPGGDVVGRLGFIAGIFPVYVDLQVRSESDYGLTAEITDASTEARLLEAETTTWGVPADPSHDTERCTPAEVFAGCKISEERPPGSRLLPFMTNPTRCGVPLSMTVSASSWAEPERFDAKSASFPEITGCNRLPFGPSLAFEPTDRHAGAPTGADVTIRLPASKGVNVLEPSQMREIRVVLPSGLGINPGSADGLVACSDGQVHFKERVAAACPDASKLADTEFEIPVLERRLRGAVYLREPAPGNPFRIWIVADDLGLHVKLPGQLRVDRASGQIESIVVEEDPSIPLQDQGIPQAPVREAKLDFKSGARAPLVNPQACGTYFTRYEFLPWSGTPPVRADTSMAIDEGCEGLGGFRPKLSAGMIDPSAGEHSPYLFTLTREDGEQNPEKVGVALPRGIAATFAGIPRCEGAAVETGACPVASRIGKVIAAVGAGRAPLWVPQPGKRPSAVYLAGPYNGGQLSIVAVVPRQAGPFDFGDEVVRSAVFVDPATARANAEADPLPQIIEGILIRYKTLRVELDHRDFTLNPTSCTEKQTDATIVSSAGAVATPSAPFWAANCAKLSFKQQLSLRLQGGTHRGAHPRLEAVLTMPPGGANIAGASVALPHSEFLDQAHIKTVCTRVQFAARKCPAGSVYGRAVARTPLFDFPLEGPVYLRSSNHALPDLVVALKGPNTLPIEIDLAGRIDSVNGGIRTTFEGIPDAPVRRFTLSMQGGAKGLLVNSDNLCTGSHRATAKFSAQNGRKRTLHPRLRASCGRK